MTHLARYYERAFWTRQRWPLARALFDAVLLLVCAGLVALALTRMAAEGSGVAQPSVSADPFTSDYWQMR